MNKLSKEKRQQLILVAVATLLVIAGFWYGIINLQKEKLKELSHGVAKAQQRLSNVQKAINAADKIEADLKEATQKLSAVENNMASGDLFSWFVLMLREFQSRYKVDIPQYSPEPPSEVNLLANFPYKQVTYVVRGIAYYNELGKFVADFENQLPYMRVQNLEMQPNLAATPGAHEQLGFKMEIVSLVKPAGP
jgi:hypothetical protein